MVAFEDFAAMDLRLVEILDAKPVAGADKLLEIRVDLGSEQRTVVSGIAQHFAPDELKVGPQGPGTAPGDQVR